MANTIYVIACCITVFTLLTDTNLTTPDGIGIFAMRLATLAFFGAAFALQIVRRYKSKGGKR